MKSGETTEEIYENKLLVEANYEMYNLKTNVKKILIIKKAGL